MSDRIEVETKRGCFRGVRQPSGAWVRESRVTSWRFRVLVWTLGSRTSKRSKVVFKEDQHGWMKVKSRVTSEAVSHRRLVERLL